MFTPQQYAQALVASFPYLPDALALAGCIAAAESPSSARPMTTWPGPPPPAARAEGADPNPSSNANSPADDSADGAAAAARTLKPAAPSGEVPAGSDSMTSAFRAAAQAPSHKA